MRKKVDLNGFTIVELLIVVVVIAILASLTIVSYNGISKRAIESSLKTDLTNTSKKIENAKTLNGSYPSSQSNADIAQSGTNSVTYIPRTNGYCITAQATNGMSFYLLNTGGLITSGICPLGDNVTTLAGSGSTGYADGTGAAAQFYYPSAVTTDSNGFIYVADERNHRIRKITPTGVVTTLAGSGVAGFANGTGTAAQFNRPSDVVTDSSGNVYVTDSDNHRIRKITPAGVVTTLAGSGVDGFAEGTGTAAQFSYPWSLAIDSTGTLYIADEFNYKVRKVTSAGVVSTLAGSIFGYQDGTGAGAQFSRPNDVAVDASGTVYVSDYSNLRIRKITPAGVVTTFAGSGVQGSADGTGTSASFNYPMGIAVDSSGNVYVSDSDNNRIRKITPAGVVTTIAGSGVDASIDGLGSAASFSYPMGLTVSSTGVIYVADGSSSKIRKIN